ncbi:MAG: M23 family metallopeptidase [Rhodocyclaceae bacterium]|nr:M23 family metallopeptidase [Rhodocyclaceae bacterium]
MLRRAVLCLLGLISVFVSVAALAQSVPRVRVELQVQGRDRLLVARNGGVAAMSLEVTLELSRGVRSDRGSLLRAVVAPRSSTTLARLTVSTQPGERRIGWRVRESLGDPRAVHSPAVRYRVPFAAGQRFRVTQAPGGRLTTHVTPDAREAIDIVMPVGTPVLAARDGWVVDNVRYFGDGGPSRDLLMRANYVRVYHDDGTWAVYAHLDSFSSAIAPGKRVRAGDELGKSGNSGYSSGPHLHFVVQKNGGTRPLSLPIRFLQADGGALTVRAGGWLTAPAGGRAGRPSP